MLQNPGQTVTRTGNDDRSTTLCQPLMDQGMFGVQAASPDQRQLVAPGEGPLVGHRAGVKRMLQVKGNIYLQMAC